MQLNELPASASDFSRVRPEMPDDFRDGTASFIDPLELEALALILEHSLKVHTAHHFFCWTQGMLQNLIRHEVLICALRKGEAAAFHVDSFSSNQSEPAVIKNLFNQDSTLVPHLLKLWEEGHFQPIHFNLVDHASTVSSNLGRELIRLGASEVLAHGTHDSFGRPASFFLFACQPGAVKARQRHLAALLAPSLHAAWVHTQFTRTAHPGQAPGRAEGNDILTLREREILGWIYQGKSNIEIGMILGISPLTVKNHVQKILRRLKVINRAQAVGKALSLRILDGSLQR